MHGKYVIGLTGNIATGKSLVLRMLKELGAYTIDADELVHVLMRRGGPLYDRIGASWATLSLPTTKRCHTWNALPTPSSSRLPNS